MSGTDTGAAAGTHAPTTARHRLARMLEEGVVVCDGAMGTMLHSAGIPLDRSLCEVNVAQPELVRDLHVAYVAAGARVVQTNTFGANRLRLAGFGLEDRVTEINVAGARLAREAVAAQDTPALVAGSVGPATSTAPRPHAAAGADAALAEQICALTDWVDLLILETFGDLDSLAQAIEVARQESDLPVIAQMTFSDDERTLRGETPQEVGTALDAPNLVAIGANCTVGPALLQQVVTELAAATELPVSVQPNAGQPLRAGRHFRYARNTEYFAQAARLFVEGGAGILGGCCGTTPAHIRMLAREVAGLRPTRAAAPVAPAREPGRPGHGQGASTPARSGLATEPHAPAWPAPGTQVLVAALRAPRGSDIEELVRQAAALRSAGAEVLAISDPVPTRPRINPVAAGVVLHERAGADVLLPVETADRSLAALQADLLGAHALGLRMVVCRTGAPRVAGDYPDPEALWDVDSIKLIGALRRLNEGLDFRGVATPERTRFVVGGSISTAAYDRGRELDRAEEKARAGAHFLVTDPIYDTDGAREVLTRLRERGVETPVLAALAPFNDIRTVEQLSHEMPETAIRSAPLSAARRASQGPDEATELALAAAASLRELTRGFVVHAPVEWSAAAADLIKKLHERGGAP